MRPIERQVQRDYHRKRQLMRQRKLLLCAIGTLLVFSLVWSVSHSFPRYSWLKIPEGFYKPEMAACRIPCVKRPLAALPLHQEDTLLRQKLEKELAAYPSVFKPHLFYFNLQDYSYVDINGDDAVSAASVIKLPVLLEYFRKMDEGKLTPYTHIMYEDFEQAAGSGMLQYQPPGQPMLAQDVATKMIQNSDNTCTNILIYNMGGTQQLNQLFEDLGLKRTHISNWLPDLTGTNVISMHDMATVLYNISQSDALSDTSKLAALQILTGTHNRRLLPALLPKDTIIAHKTGDIGTSLGNSGLIMLPNGQKYIVTMQVERPFNNYTAKDMIQQVSKVIYDDVKGKTALANSLPESKTNLAGM